MINYAEKSSLILETFMRSADENYITARWCAANQIDVDFLWLALHALEKYMKAILLFNGKSSKEYGHDIVKLYSDVKPIAESLAPSTFARPASLTDITWREIIPEHFLERLSIMGSPGNRYNLYGYTTGLQDLLVLDQIVFSLRRLACPLDDRIFPRQSGRSSGPTHREILENQPDYYFNFYMPLDEIIKSREDSSKKSAALDLNFPFAPENFAHPPISSLRSFSNPVIDRRIFEPLMSENLNIAAQAIEVASWFLKNVQLRKGTIDSPDIGMKIDQEIKTATARINLAQKPEKMADE